MFIYLFTLFFFFFNDTATTEIYTLSLHDALTIYAVAGGGLAHRQVQQLLIRVVIREPEAAGPDRSEEHTSELQSRPHLVCRLLLEKKKTYLFHYHLATDTSRHIRQARLLHRRFVV